MKKTMKIFWLVCLVLLACTLMFTACDEEEKPNNTTDDTTDDGGNGGANISSSNNYKPFDKNMAMYYANGVNGHSILERDGSLYCVDSKGNVTYKLPDSERHVTQVYNGVFLTYDGVRGRIRKSNGEEVKIQGDSAGCDILFLSGNKYYDSYHDHDHDYNSNHDYMEAHRNMMANELLKDGYIMVLRTTDTYVGTTYELGILKTDGTWQSPLSAEHPLSECIWFGSDSFLDDLFYCQEGVIKVLIDYAGGEEGYYYNIKENHIYEFDEINLLSHGGIFNDGVCFIDNYGIYAIYPDGTSKYIDTLPSGADILFYDRSSNTGVAIYFSDLDDYCLCNMEGKIIKRIDGNMRRYNPIEGTDTIQLMFVTENDKYFYTKIDTLGNFLFEPIMLEIPTNQYGEYLSFDVSDKNGNIVGGYEGDSYSIKIIVDDSGKILGEYDGTIRNGILKEDVSDNYINDNYININEL